ncbi:hypothetical protein AAC387_Pa04g1627 [Persea americana]
MDRFSLCLSAAGKKPTVAWEAGTSETKKGALFLSYPSRDNEEEGLAATSPDKWDPDSVGLGVTRRRRREDSRRRRSEGDLRLSALQRRRSGLFSCAGEQEVDCRRRRRRCPPLSVSDAGVSSLENSGLGSFSATFEGWVLQHFFSVCKKDLSGRGS